MNDEQNGGGLPQLEETTYTPKAQSDALSGIQAAALAEDDFVDVRKKTGPVNVAAAALADDDYVDVRKKSGPIGVAAPTLADDTYVDPRKQPAAPTPAPAPAPVVEEAPFVPQPLNEQQLAVLAQRRAEAGQPPYTPEQIAAIQNAYLQKQLEAHNAQLAAARAAAAQTPPPEPSAPPVQAAVLEEPTYVAPPKKEPSVPQPSAEQAAALLEEPAEPERRGSRFNEADLEAAKASAKKRAVESALQQPEVKDKEAARRVMNELRMEREAELARKGFRVVLLLLALGVVSAVSLFLFSTRDFQPDMANGFFQGLSDATVYISGLLGLSAVLLLFRVEFVKKLASFLFGLNGIGMGIIGFMELSQKVPAGMGLTVTFWLVSILLSLVICFVLSTNESVNMYYKRREDMVL